MDSITPFFSVITPTFNRRESLARAIQSLQQQTFQNFEHIIVDDGSTDETADYVLSIADPRIRYFRCNEWRGANFCRNEGIRISRSEWLSFLDSDDEYLPDRLCSLRRSISDQPTTELFLSSFVTRKVKSDTTSVNDAANITGKQLELAAISSSLLLAGSSITVKRNTIMKSGGYSPTIRRLQDREVLIKLSKVCGASVRSEVDWIKNVSEDSISRSPTGYAKSWEAVVALHPYLADEYRDQIGCHIARHIVASLLQGNMRSVFEIFQTNSSSPLLRFGLLNLIILFNNRRNLRRVTQSDLPLVAFQAVAKT